MDRQSAITLTLSKGRKRSRVIIEDTDILRIYNYCRLKGWRIVREYWHATGEIVAK